MKSTHAHIEFRYLPVLNGCDWNMKIRSLANFGMQNSIMAFIFEINQIFINYSYIDDMLPFWYQTRSQKHENS